MRTHRPASEARVFARLLVTAAFSCAVGCSLDQTGLMLNTTGAGGATIDGIGGQGADNGVGGKIGTGGTFGTGGMLGAGGTFVGGSGGTGAGGQISGSGGTGGGGNGVGGTAAGGNGAGGNAAGGNGTGGRIVDGSADVRDGSVVDTGVDLPVDRIVDVGPDLPICDTAHGMHRCGETCVSNSSIANCGPTSCTACPVPANSVASCDGTSCGFVCNAGFMPLSGACVRTCDTNCATNAVKVTLPGGRFTGTTMGTSANAGSCGGGNAPEAVYQLTLTQTSDVFVTTHGSKFDTLIYMRSGCCGTEIACNNDADGRTTSMFNALGVAAGTYDIFIDGAGSTGGAYTVDIYTSPTSANPGESCGRPMRIASTAFTGDTCGYRDDDSAVSATCGKDDGGLDVVFYFVLDQTTTVTFDTCTNTCIDSELYFREICTTRTMMSEVTCNDDACGGQPANPDSCVPTASQSRMQATTLGPGPHYVVVDTFVNPAPVANCGLFTLTPTGVPP